MSCKAEPGEDFFFPPTFLPTVTLTPLNEWHIVEPNKGSGRASDWSRLCLITLFVFCRGAACADLGRGDTGRQAALSGQQATLGFSLSPLPARRMTQRLSVHFYSVGEMNRPDVAPLMPLARQKAAVWFASLPRSQILRT